MLLPGLAVAHNGADDDTAATRSPEAVHQHGKTKTDDTAKTSGSTKTPEVKAARITPAELCTRMTTFSGKTEGDTDTRFKELAPTSLVAPANSTRTPLTWPPGSPHREPKPTPSARSVSPNCLLRPPMTPKSRIFWPSRRP
jgi:hypothetical protein